MSFPKNEWGEIPPFKLSLREIFQSSFPQQSGVIYVSIPLLIDILKYVRAGKKHEPHYTNEIFSEVCLQRSIQKKDYLAVDVKQYVLMQKDIDMRIEKESLCHRPYPKVLSDLRHIAGQLMDGRHYVCRDEIKHLVRNESLEPRMFVY